MTAADIRSLRREACDDDDHYLVALCDIALDGVIDWHFERVVTPDQAQRLRSLDKREATAALARVLDGEEP